MKKSKTNQPEPYSFENLCSELTQTIKKIKAKNENN